MLIFFRFVSGIFCAHNKVDVMFLNWAFLFLILALVAAVLGFGGIAQQSAGIAKILFIVFLIIFVVSFLF